MPCFTIQESQINWLSKSTDIKILTEGLRAAGFDVYEYEASDGRRLTISKNFQNGTYYAKDGRLEAPASWDTNEIKRAYSREVVDSQARKFGWKIAWKTNAKGEDQAEVVKR